MVVVEGRPGVPKPGLSTGWLTASFLKHGDGVRTEWNMHPISLPPPDPPRLHQPRCLSPSARVDLVPHSRLQPCCLHRSKSRATTRFPGTRELRHCFMDS